METRESETFRRYMAEPEYGIPVFARGICLICQEDGDVNLAWLAPEGRPDLVPGGGICYVLCKSCLNFPEGPPALAIDEEILGLLEM